MMVELIDGFFAEHPRNSRLRRQQVIEQLMRQIMHYDVKFAANRRPPQSAPTRSTDGRSGSIEA
jgi:hypothetical protein